MSNDSTIKAIRGEKCPRCHQGDLFVTSSYKITGFYKMHKVCPSCQQTFEPEPGFYFGAMFVAYGLLVVMAIVTWLVLFFAFHPVFEVYVVAILILNVLLLPFIFRFSRTLFLYGFGGVRFKKDFLNKKL
jgi:uncharacterized protein (DUF983 family)